MTERDGVVLRNFRRDLVAPRIRPWRSTEQPTDEPPQYETHQDGDPKNPDYHRWIIFQIIRLTELNQGSNPSQQRRPSPGPCAGHHPHPGCLRGTGCVESASNHRAQDRSGNAAAIAAAHEPGRPWHPTGGTASRRIEPGAAGRKAGNRMTVRIGSTAPGVGRESVAGPSREKWPLKPDF